MNNLEPVNNIILVELFDKRQKRQDGNPFASIVTSANLGTVKYSSSEAFPVGTKVYFGNKYEKILIEGVETLAMNVDAVIAKVKD